MKNGQGPETREGLAAWCLYDWANSAYPTVITTFVFAAYFTKSVAVDPIIGTSQWGWTMSISALLVALVGPLLGAIADHSGKRKPWLFFFTLISAVSATSLWFVTPETHSIIRALILVGVGTFSFEVGMIFYNAMLPDLSPPEKIGRWSGWGWGFGYVGGLCCLTISLVAFVQPETPSFGLDKETAEHLRVSGPIVGFWILIFAIPLFIFTPDQPSRHGLFDSIGLGFKSLFKTFKQGTKYVNVFRFLIARMIYTDGLNTLFAFGGIYAVGSFNFSFQDLILFGIGINITAGLGAICFAWVDDWIGPKQTILISITALIILSSTLLIIENTTLFWYFGLGLGIFIGPAQSASRSFMAQLSPPKMKTGMFGMFALSGKATAFLGPALLALLTYVFTSQRAGMASIIVFFIIGGVLLFRVNDPH